MSGCGCDTGDVAAIERRSLWLLLGINATMFVGEMAASWVGQSTGLMADSLDMLADAAVYGIAIYAAGRSSGLQATAASASGVVQIGLGLGVMFEVVRRYLHGSEPVSSLMMGVGAIAFAANVSCLAILAKHRTGGVHMRASWIFSTNDVIANLGVVVSGGLVLLFHSRLPDLVIGGMIAILVMRGGVKILRESRRLD